jgi:predicted RNA-binding protein associated with RNAse of E/G family
MAVFVQPILEETPEYVVTFAEHVDLPRPVHAREQVVLEPGAPVVWFTYPGAWHDVGRFHLADGTFTGYYANVLTPVVMDGDRWETTDLSLDVWCGVDGRVEVLDLDEFEEARAQGWIDDETAKYALQHAGFLASAARHGEWPPAHLKAWDLARARAALAQLREANG